MNNKNTDFNYIDTPQVTFNGFISIMRNVYLSLIKKIINQSNQRILIHLVSE